MIFSTDAPPPMLLLQTKKTRQQIAAGMNGVDFMKLKTFVDDYEKQYVRAADIPRLFGISRRTVNRFMDKMRAIPAYHDAVIRPSAHLTLINLKKFEQFLISQDGAYLKGVKP